MSTQGGTLRAPIHVPMGVIITALVTLALAVSIGLTATRLGVDPVGDAMRPAAIDWTAQLGHPRVGDHTLGQEHRVYMGGFGRVPEQRLHPTSPVKPFEMKGFGRIPEQRLHPMAP